MRRCDLWGVPFDGGATLGWPGSRYGPERVRRALGWITMRVQDGRVFDVDAGRLREVGPDLLVDRGDVEVVPHDLMATLEATSRAVGETVAAGRVPLVVGGDDSLLFAVVRGVHDATSGTVGVVHFDAHFDLMDENPRQGRYSHSSGMRRALELPRVRADASIQVGVRHYNFPASRAFAEEVGLEQLPAREVQRIGIEAVAARVRERARRADHVVWGFDVDVVDPAFAPGARAHEPGGLTAREALDAVELLAPACHAFFVAEVNPTTDVGDMTSTLAAYLVYRFAVAGARPEGAS